MRQQNSPAVKVIVLAVALSWLTFSASTDAADPPARLQQSFVNSVGMKMLPIPSGSFEMGTKSPRVDGWDEAPVHQVRISNHFYVSETEVTVEQYRKSQPDFAGSQTALPWATGLSWHEAQAFCNWLSEREATPYRLPTEAEWEYVARAGTVTPYWSGEEPPNPGTANPWGLKNIHWDPSEWVADWYGPYSACLENDPVGPAHGLVKVIRGGGLDEYDAYYARSANRAGYAPAFSMMPGTATQYTDYAAGKSPAPSLPGLVGLWYGDPQRKRPQGWERILTLEQDWSASGHRGSEWSVQWSGTLLAPADGEVQFFVSADSGAMLELDGVEIANSTGSADARSGKAVLQKGKPYPVTLTYVHYRQPRVFLCVHWAWQGSPKSPISEQHLRHSPFQAGNMRSTVEKELRPQPGHHTIGFRVVQAATPQTKSRETPAPFVTRCVVQQQPMLNQGPAPDEPWFRRRLLLPIPPENVPREHTRWVGLHPGMMDHNHSPALEVCPNGDLLAIYSTSQREYEPEVSLIATRLRFGSTQWDMPEILFDFPDSNEVSPCLYAADQQLMLFWGSPRLTAGYPFQWTTSTDNGASWSQIRFPQFTSQVGPHSRQPINSVLRDGAGVCYVPCDGVAATSVLWASKDALESWWDTGGRTGGRHTTLAILQDGRFLGMGGKSSEIDGYMPRSISSDGGKTWQVSETPFAALGSNQRPSLIRLHSGRLFLCGDFQHRNGTFPQGIRERGCYVALSEDEGETWHVKKLPGTLPHEYDNLHDTLGYSVARQASNGTIHIITSMNHPCLHFELNEAWILSDDAAMQHEHRPVLADVQEYRATYASGAPKAVWQGGTTVHGAYRLDGRQTWFFENGRRQWEATYSAGKKVGTETSWDRQGNLIWCFNHGERGVATWTQYWANGKKKCESSWRDGKAEGTATRWDRQGTQISKHVFSDGRWQQKSPGGG